VISQFVPAQGAVVVVDLPGSPPISAAYGDISSAGEAILAAARAGDEIVGTSCLTPLVVEGIFVGALAFGSVPPIVQRSELLARVRDQITRDFGAVAHGEQIARADAPQRVQTAVRELGALDDVVRLQELASALLLLPEVVGVSLTVKAPWLLDEIELERGWPSGPSHLGRQASGSHSSVKLCLDGFFEVPGSIANSVVNDAATAVQRLLNELDAAWVTMFADDQDPANGLLSGPVLERILGTTMHRADQRGTGVCVVSVSIEGASGLRGDGSGDRIDAMLEMAAHTLPDVVRQCRLCRIGPDHLLALVPDADELEATSLETRVRTAVDFAIRPKGIAPRSYRSVIGTAVYPAHANTATALIEHSMRAER
jgi:GGDEF domain-containing protein